MSSENNAFRAERQRLSITHDVTFAPTTQHLGRLRLSMVNALLSMAGSAPIEFDEPEFVSDSEVHRYALRQTAWVV